MRKKEAIKPMPLLAETAIAIGHLQFQADRDGITREVAVTWEKLPNSRHRSDSSLRTPEGTRQNPN